MTRSIQRRIISLALLSRRFASWRVQARAQQRLALGPLPNISVLTLMVQYHPMREYLARVLHRPVLSELDARSAEGPSFLSATGLQGLRAVSTTMESMDPYVGVTCATLSGAS